MDWFKKIKERFAEQPVPTSQDECGQPLTRAYRSEAVIDRQIDELIGLIKGVMTDGMVHQGEVEFLIGWMEANRAVCDKWLSIEDALKVCCLRGWVGFQASWVADKDNTEKPVWEQ